MDFLVLLVGSQFSVFRGDDVYGRFAGAQGRNQPTSLPEALSTSYPDVALDTEP